MAVSDDDEVGLRILEEEGFQAMSEHALSLEPSTERVVLSTKRVASHNRALDEYMEKHHAREWLRSQVERDIADYVFAATGRAFLRVLEDLEENLATPSQPDGAIYIMVDEVTAGAMYDEACWIIDMYAKH